MSLKRVYQSVLADDEQALGSVELGQSDFFIESAVASHHHRDAIRETSLRDVGGGAQDRCCQVIDLETRLRDKNVCNVNRSWRKICYGSTLNTNKKNNSLPALIWCLFLNRLDIIIISKEKNASWISENERCLLKKPDVERDAACFLIINVWNY